MAPFLIFFAKIPMAKKNNKPQKQNIDPNSNSLDLSKGFGNGAFASLKSLQEVRKAEAEDKALAQKQLEQARLEAQKAAQKAAELEWQYENATGRGKYTRFTEEDLTDTSNMSDMEIFEASMKKLDQADLYTEKFNKKEAPKKVVEAEHQVTMTEEEKEFALFTQEMAITQVQRLQKPGKKAKQTPVPERLNPNINAAPSERPANTRTDFVTPVVTVTQSVKGPDALAETQDQPQDPLTENQHHYLKEIHRYQERFGGIITLKLRGYALEAAMRRLNDFIDACCCEKRQYGLVICGKGLGSQGEPVIKLETIARCKADDRIVEYVPVLNEDGDFGSLYIVFKTK